MVQASLHRRRHIEQKLRESSGYAPVALIVLILADVGTDLLC